MSNSANIKYQPLSQTTPSDDEDEGFDDNILYDSRLVKGPSMDRRNIFELERLGQPRVSPPPSVQYLGRGRRTCVLITVLLVILLGAAAAVVFPIINLKYNHGVVHDIHSGKSSEDWTRMFNNTWTESSVRLLDVNGDGLDDIVVGLADQDTIEAALKHEGYNSITEYCLANAGKNPCGATLAAFRGYDGQEIWRAPTRSVVIYAGCGDIDINNDDLNDCLVTGRHATCQAIDVQTGKILWAIDPDSPKWSSHFVSEWNVYRTVTLPDVDADGVLDLLVSHGGDKNKEPEDHIRKPGRLILLSGKTGLPIGNFFELPENEETYMPPVKYVTRNNAVYILFGSGGETVPGSLMAVSLPDLYHSITGKSLPGVDEATYSWLNAKVRDGNGVAVLHRAKTKGVMVPPVLVDIDDDGTTDILVSTFDGTLALFDGNTLKENWRREFPNMESYSSPTPGYFDGDEVLDFLIHLNEGEWDKYNSSKTIILNGIDGSDLWSVQGGSYSYSSDLSLRTTTERLSVFLMKLVGMNTTADNLQADMGVTVTRRHLGSHDSVGDAVVLDQTMDAKTFRNICVEVGQSVAGSHVTCDRDLSSLTQEVFLFDRSASQKPVRILQQEAFRYRYSLQHKPGSLHCHPLSVRTKDKINMCAVLTPTSYTGAVGDVDDDGSLDYIHITQMMGSNRSDTFDVTGPISSVIISKHSLEAAISKGDLVQLDLIQNSVSQQFPQSSLRHLQSLVFLPPSQQAWAQYLGSRGSSWYYVLP